MTSFREDRPRRRHPLPADVHRLDPGGVPGRPGPRRPELHHRPRGRPAGRASGAIFELVNVFALHRLRRRRVLGRQAGPRGPRDRLPGDAAVRGARSSRSASSASFAVTSLRQQAAAGGGRGGLRPGRRARSSTSAHWAIVIGRNMAAFNALMLGTALYRARLVPRAIPALGLIGAPHPHHLRHRHDARPHRTRAPLFHAIAVLPFFIWELASVSG